MGKQAELMVAESAYKKFLEENSDFDQETLKNLKDAHAENQEFRKREIQKLVGWKASAGGNKREKDGKIQKEEFQKYIASVWALHVVTETHMKLADKSMTQEQFDAVFEKSWAKWDADKSGYVELSEFKMIGDDVAIAVTESLKKSWATHCKEHPEEVTPEDQKMHEEGLANHLATFKNIAGD